jgi:NTE family protein
MAQATSQLAIPIMPLPPLLRRSSSSSHVQDTGSKNSNKKTINLALQGGGAHGAFTWGVLDALIEDGRLEVEALTGTSAGAMNAAVYATGLAQDGPQGARKALSDFWRDVSLDGHISPSARMLLDVMMTPWKIGAAAGQSVIEASRNVFSPYELNPLDINPLRSVVEKHINFKMLRETKGPNLFIAATSVHTGKLRIFKRQELNADMLMASAALPFLFRAVSVAGEPYWDGGFMGNPALFPLFNNTDVNDIVLVQINPIERNDTPDNAVDIMERVNEITFNAPLLGELRAIDFVSRMISDGALKGTHHKAIRMHRIEAQDKLNAFGTASKLKADWAFFTQLFEIGRETAHHFMARHFDDIGKQATLDLSKAIG